MLSTTTLTTIGRTLCISLAVIMAANTSAAPLILSDIPLFLKEDLPPNIVLSIDNSSSMRRASIYDSDISCSTDSDQSHPCYESSTFNKLYYDPLNTYLPPLKADGTFAANASFNNAWINGFDQSMGTPINLEFQYLPTAELFIKENPTQSYHSTIRDGAGTSIVRNSSRAYYMNIDTNAPGCSDVTTFDNTNENCFVLVDVATANSGPNGSDERQNFANWYSYHRTRLLTVKSAIATSFSQLKGSTRVAWQDLHFVSLGQNSFDPANNNFIQPFTGSHRDDFYSWLQALPIQPGTPLIKTLDAVGFYMSTTDKYNPFALNPGTGSDELEERNDLSCRTNYHALFSDGSWNDGNSAPNNIDIDGVAKTLPDGTIYTPQAPYQSPATKFLSDRAFDYWSTDLRTDLDNNINPYKPIDSGDETADYWNPENNPATWQHLVNFTVTLGVDGTLDFPGDLDDLISGTKNWGTSLSKGDRIDDNWHAAINSRGAYFATNNSSELEAAFTAILNRVTEQSGSSASAVTTDSTQAATTNTLFQAKFDSKNWTGTLTAFDFQNLVKGDVQFEAGCLLTGGPCPTEQSSSVSARNPDNRLIITTNGAGTAIPFRYDLFNSTTQSLIDSDATLAEEKVDYIRGDRNNEESDNGAGTLRKRTSVLGDIIHSSPVLVKNPKRFFPDRGSWDPNHSGVLPENREDAQSFSDFLSSDTVTTRQGTLFVGANDGMLHAFNAVTGKEEFAYFPGDFIDDISVLADPDYQHRYFVDGSPVTGEAFYDTSWHSIVVGQMRGGGQTIYAIDATAEITDTDTETSVTEKLLWEFSHPDLGYGFGEPIIARLHNNRWAAIFGNGFNNTEADGNASTTGEASLFIVDIETGDLIKHIETGAGDTPTPNGITGVTAADFDNDFIDDVVYAGDLQGNVWKFDLRSEVVANWGVDYVVNPADANSAPIPLFSADTNQAITAKPNFIQAENGVMLTFGTGKYLESTDNSDLSVVNSYYGVWDHNVDNLAGGTLTRSDLTPRLLIAAQDPNDPNLILRRLEGEEIEYLNSDVSRQGWYFDFPAGELQITTASQFDTDLTLFTTFKPNDDPCPGDNANLGTSWLYVFKTLQGKSPPYNVIDTDGNNNFDDDALADDNFASGIQLENAGVLAPLTLVEGGEISDADGLTYDTASILTSSLEGEIGKVGIRKRNIASGLEGRVKWRQIR